MYGPSLHCVEGKQKHNLDDLLVCCFLLMLFFCKDGELPQSYPLTSSPYIYLSLWLLFLVATALYSL